MVYQIAIIGVGALGKRHLQSIVNSKLEMVIYCYDINKHVLDSFEWENKYNNKTLIMITSFEELPKVVDFAIFAMTANGRREMFDRLIEHCTVKKILFEKVLFQKVEDYEYVGRKLKELSIKAWVNCARRQMECYQELKKELEYAKEMRVTISGGEWGLACNTIHQIDLIEFLSGSSETKVDSIELLPIITDSKRAGFKEVYGNISGHSGKCSFFSVTCMKDTNVPIVVTISTDVGQYIIFESKQKMMCMVKNGEYDLIEKDFVMPYQSQMTQFVMEDILLTGESRLTEYDVSSRLHLEFIEPLIKFFNKNGWENNSCPIT
ncbi:Gfo/Idh/MocA family oxidoreductase [Selenomonas sp. FC4001]|uniref:Gfo/Idh/MocA family oxidoreductase n=1 Tax=Selenomonas sp. FC4001 TaxID=1408313 RepID=UPI00055DABF7|nr:Gfo/Idh/MocA family oxidoreductase [Selenomonas sp. FC4001]